MRICTLATASCFAGPPLYFQWCLASGAYGIGDRCDGNRDCSRCGHWVLSIFQFGSPSCRELFGSVIPNASVIVHELPPADLRPPSRHSQRSAFSALLTAKQISLRLSPVSLCEQKAHAQAHQGPSIPVPP